MLFKILNTNKYKILNPSTKLRFWLKGVYITNTLYPHCKAKNSNFNVFYLPHQRISQSIPFCLLINKNKIEKGYTEELIRCTLVPVITKYNEPGIRMYLYFTGIPINKQNTNVKRNVVISWCYEMCMTNTYRRTGELYLPEKNDLLIFQGSNGARFSYTYSIFLTERDIEKPDLTNTFIHHRGVGACAVARSAGISMSQETWDAFPTPAQNSIREQKDDKK